MTFGMIVLLVLAAPMPPHGFDNTGTLGAMMFSLREARTARYIAGRRILGEAFFRIHAFRNIAVSTFACDNRYYIVPENPIICSLEHQHMSKNSSFFSSLSIAVEHTISQPCYLVERPQGHFTSRTCL